jgi:steroid 5-alpha reductase family enzyme
MKSRLYVFGQFALLLLLLIWPDDVVGWGFFDFLFEIVAVLFFFGGATVVVLAIRELFNSSLPKLVGSAKEKFLQAIRVVMPEPTEDAKLVTTGIFKSVRHPIYSGLILIGYSIGIGSGPWPHLFFAIGLHVVLHYKSLLEEKFLATKFKTYKKYATTTGRFFPKVED